ncbi:hypothetical protein BZA05DRAFT_194410 [Tricharina praecox]|uniref:uncharacterized protein n=1 Tax=Tricharina praecox TaxID=43433 RepID=UPI00221E856B|nr:uncharacterized protein BZA05DRAFT_194410 [Tricharina praecox]KAF8053761.1 hypothetical protein FPV67DRAFT_1683926 [Lyophyllum atratum]KAI5856225.1 hypothetical protein BZA05DRAFT_194410 [Tricharina praecox]
MTCTIAECGDPSNIIETNADIAGIGVVCSFLVTAGLTAILSIWLMLTHESHASGGRKHVSEMGTQHKVLIPMVMSVGDIQVVTSIALLTAGLLHQCELNVYHYYLIAMMAMVSLGTHCLTWTALHGRLRQNRFSFVFRTVGQVTAVILFVWFLCLFAEVNTTSMARHTACYFLEDISNATTAAASSTAIAAASATTSAVRNTTLDALAASLGRRAAAAAILDSSTVASASATIGSAVAAATAAASSTASALAMTATSGATSTDSGPENKGAYGFIALIVIAIVTSAISRWRDWHILPKHSATPWYLWLPFFVFQIFAPLAVAIYGTGKLLQVRGKYAPLPDAETTGILLNATVSLFNATAADGITVLVNTTSNAYTVAAQDSREWLSDNSHAEWGFGQMVPLILLVTTIYSACEGYDRIRENNRQNRKEE